MSRPVFLPTQDSYTLGYGNQPYAGIPVRVFTRQTGGTQITDLVYVAADGTLGAAVTNGVLISDSNGLIPAFAGPDGGQTTVWGSHGLSGERLALTSDPTGAGGGGGGVTLKYPDGITTAAAVPRTAEVDARDFGVIANGPTSTDALTTNTANLQAFVTYVLTNSARGRLPAGAININGRIDFTTRPVWQILGAGRGVTRIRQYADNVPVLNLGSDTVSYMHSFRLADFSLDYANAQPATNTNANAILLSTMAFNGDYDNIEFGRGFYGMSVAPGIGGPWGSTFNNLMFNGNLSGGAIDMTSAVNHVPNNHWGRFTVSCNNMVGPVFAGLRGYNFRIDTLEFLSANQGPTLMEFAAGMTASIGTLKLEVSTYSTTRAMFFFSGGNFASIDEIFFSSSAPTVNALPAGETLTLIKASGLVGNGGFIHVGNVQADGFSSTTGAGKAYIAEASAGTPIVIDRASYASPAWELTNIGSSVSADYVTVTNQVSGRVSQDRGNADYAVSLSDPNTNVFSTAFTAPRTINLPSANGDLFNGLYYEFVFSGAINGTNTAVIKCGAATLRTQGIDGVVLRFTYRRHPSSAASGWVLTKNEILAESASADDALLTSLVYGS